MDDRASSLSDRPRQSGHSGNKGLLFVGGAVLAVIGAFGAMQYLRAEPGSAAQESGADEQTGRVKMDAFRQPVSRVNGDNITYEVLARECVERYGAEVLENVINRTIIQQACASQGVTVTEAEVNQEIVRISKKLGLPTDQWYQMIQSERGLSPVQYRRDIIWPMLALKKLAGSEVQITRQMMEEAYVDNYGPRVKARVMFLDNLRRAQEIQAQVQKNPAEFERLAREFSVETNSRALGGTVPPIRRYSGAHEEIRRTAFTMQTPDEVSGVIQIGVGQYVIMKYEGRTEPVAHSREDVQTELHAELMEQEVQKMVAKTFERYKKTARVENYITGESQNLIQPVSGTAGQ